MLAVLAFTACSNDRDDAGSSNNNHIWHVTLQASMGDATNRALSESGDNISASFAENDEVVVIDADGSTIVGTLKAQTAGGSTTLTGSLNATSLDNGETVTLHYLSATPNYDGQVGTLEGINSYATGTLKVETKSPLTFESNSVSLAPQQSITKFSFTSDGTTPVNVKTFGIAADGLVQSIAKNGTETVGAVTGTLSTPSSEVYVALRNNSGSQQTYSFYAQDNSHNWYYGTKKANLENGKNYTAEVTLTKIETTLTSSSNEGTIGVIDGLPAIVVNLGGTIGKKAVALMNAGALCPEHYGKYYTFAELSSAVSSPWHVPTQTELESFASKAKTWVSQNGVYGCKFTLGSNTLFLPAAGYYDNDPTPSTLFNPTWCYYWSSTLSGDMVNSLQFHDTSISSYTNSSYKVDGLTVRPFHAL